jgi:autotransporter-associated beta strand protein
MFRPSFQVAFIAAIISIQLPLDAATYTWTGATDSLWTTTTNWNPTATAGGPVAADLLVFTGSTNASVNLSGSSQTVANISYTGMTLPLTVTATNGNLTINGGNQSFGTQANGSLVTDYSGLSAFTYTQTGTSNSFLVQMTIPAAGPTSGTSTLRLATQGSGTNFIRASTLAVGAAAGSSNGTAWGGVLGLGKANTFNATNFNIGGFNGSGSVAFQSGITNGTLVLRGTGGAATRVTTMDVGATSSGSRDGSGTLDLTGGTLDALVTTLTVGRHGAGANNGPTSSLTMPGGSLDTTTLILGEKTNTTGTPTIISTFSQLGGSVVSGTMRFGNITASSAATTPIFTSIYNLSSGTLRAGVITSEPSVTITATTTSGSTSVRRIAWSGGTISNYDASTDLTISGTSTNAGYTMQLVLGSTTTPQVFSAETGRTITVGPSAVISGTGSLQKQGAGTLRLSSANTYAGSATLSAGIMRLGIANGLSGNAALIMNPSSGTATLDLAGFSTSAGSLSSSGAGESIIDVASTGTSTLTVGGDNTNTTFAGRLRNSGGATSVLGFTKNGSGTWTLTGSNSAIAGNLVFNNGKVTIDPGSTGSFTSTGRFQMLPGSGTTATLEILSGSNSFSTAAGISGMADNSASGTAVWNLSGGATTLALSTNRFLIGNKGTGNVNVSNNASFTITGTTDLVVGGDQAFAANNATGAIAVSSGTLSITGSGNLILGRNVSGTTTGANGTINLDGGVFATIRSFTMATGSGMGTGTVNFNGGTLRALATSTNFIAVTAANVRDGGAVIDTNTFNITIAQSLQSAGTGGLTKLGAGVLTLSASNTYIGTTAVGGGTLKAENVDALGAGGVTVASGATLDLSSLGIANAITNNGGTVSNAANYAGSQTLSGSSSFGALGGTVTVNNGGIANFAGAMTGGVTVNTGGIANVAAGGSVAGALSLAGGGLTGVGTVGVISGTGLVGPGNSPGIMTSTGSLDPTGGVDFAFEFSGTAPTWSAAGASVNDVLRLTTATPITTALTSGNVINVYLNPSQALAAGDTFLGGLFIDQSQGSIDLAPLLANATFAYFVAGGSDVTYGGVGYSTFANYVAANPAITGITPSTVTVASADFAGGTVTNGQTLQFAIVPEPSAVVLFATGAAAAGFAAVRRFRRR